MLRVRLSANFLLPMPDTELPDPLRREAGSGASGPGHSGNRSIPWSWSRPASPG